MFVVSRVISYLPEQPGPRGVRTAKKGRGEMVTPSYPFVEGRDPFGGTDKVKLWSSVVKKRNRVERASGTEIRRSVACVATLLKKLSGSLTDPKRQEPIVLQQFPLSVQEALWSERVWVPPVCGVHVEAVETHEECCTLHTLPTYILDPHHTLGRGEGTNHFHQHNAYLGNDVSHQISCSCSSMCDSHWYNIAMSLDFHQDCLNSWLSLPPNFSIQLLMDSVLDVRVKEHVGRSEPQGVTGGFRASHKQVQAQRQQLQLYQHHNNNLL
uniref:Uncharacterized protein n=1 Tax=Timema bartmani TaxID=61472 RepID=A0A7R9F0Q8_9NEOP|nr:unnamed protein product [Timema bartmani]